MKIKPIVIALLAVNLAACASQELNKIPDGMKVATKESVNDCKFLGDIHGISSLYGVFAEVALAKSRQQAFEQAKNLGANTVVWEPFSTQHGSTSVHGNAYKCQ
jgi:Domain of unknown function (DUF4156)